MSGQASPVNYNMKGKLVFPTRGPVQAVSHRGSVDVECLDVYLRYMVISYRVLNDGMLYWVNERVQMQSIGTKGVFA